MPLEIGGHTLQGEFSRIAKEVNDMVKQLNLFSMEVTRVAREVEFCGFCLLAIRQFLDVQYCW